MDWKTFISTEILTVIVTGLMGWFLSMRKYKAESKDLESKVTKTIFFTYNEEFEFMKKRISEYVGRIEGLEKKVDSLTLEKNKLRQELAKFERKFGKQPRTRKIIEDETKQ